MGESPTISSSAVLDELNLRTRDVVQQAADGAFKSQLRSLLNRHSREGRSDTPDFLLAEYMLGALKLYEESVNAREVWYGRKTVPAPDVVQGRSEDNQKDEEEPDPIRVKLDDATIRQLAEALNPVRDPLKTAESAAQNRTKDSAHEPHVKIS